MGNLPDRPPTDYRQARIASAFLLFAIVAFIVVFDALRSDFEVNPLILVPILAVGVGLLGVDIPSIGRK